MRVALFSLAYFWFPKCCFISLLGIQYKCCHNFFSRRCLWKLWQDNWTIHLRTWNSDLKWTELCQLVTHYSATCLMGVFSKSEFRNNFHMIKVMCISFFFYKWVEIQLVLLIELSRRRQWTPGSSYNFRCNKKTSTWLVPRECPKMWEQKISECCWIKAFITSHVGFLLKASFHAWS